ncbi:MAG: AAA family ATPase [Holophagales bacterium]|nr:AAA family ATPase [Holophagales bacterium]MYA09394.1 AAA family ATPase [Holophagales bacterium]MYD23558.1 AAA family ATPase [Holophagales bacterium]MYG31081.1 AAA family ATPase [Holophagales bacterium]MYI31374.1 AAA family ATPase [Holophagales bacterium]
MKILRIRAHEFGKLNGEFDLAPGMTVIHGDNEAGKSTWLQAIFAALCGRRRGRGANTLEEREFERQYEPWSGKPWRATVKLQLDDGRRIEIQQRDLKAKESVAHDADTGRQIGDELIYRGSIDGSRFLGLNRQVMPSTLVIGQGDIQRLRQTKGDEASALKKELQRAAASAGGAATAVEAIRLLKSYARDQIGTERRNSTKPLQRAVERLSQANTELDAGRNRQLERDRLENTLAAAREEAASTATLVRSCERALAERELRCLDARLKNIEKLATQFRDGKPPEAPGEGPDAAIERELRTALLAYRIRPEEPAELRGPGADEMARELSELPKAAVGDREIAPEVAAAARGWREAREARAVRERLGPGDAPEATLTKAAELIARRALTVLELPPLGSSVDLERRVQELLNEQKALMAQLEANSGFGKWPWIGAPAGGLLGVLGVLDLLPRLVGAGGWLLAIVCFALMYRAQRRTSRPRPYEQADRGAALADARAELRDLKRQHEARRRQIEAATRELAELGIETDPDAVRAALEARERRNAWDRERETWERWMASARTDEAIAEKTLRDALTGRGFEDAQAGVDDLFHRYEQACRRSAELAAGTDRREALAARLEARRQAERAAATQRQNREAAEERFRTALTAAGFPGDATDDPELWADDWLSDRERRTGQRQRDWDRLQHLLDGRDRQSLQDERAETAGRIAAIAGAESEAAAALQALTSTELERKLATTRKEAGRAGREVSRFEGQLAADADLPALAELEEELAAAEHEVKLLRRAGEIVDIATTHLEAAQEEVHRMLAPDLRQGLAERLNLVTDGRYSAVRIDPEEGLEVQLEVEDGEYRSASELSHGTIDQVYLLLRIGLAEALGDKRESAPLFLDDATVHIDTDRTMRFLELLLVLSKERQIVALSQEEEVRAWAERRLPEDPRHRLIELGPDGLPLQARTDSEPAAADADEPAPDPERQHSLL